MWKHCFRYLLFLLFLSAVSAWFSGYIYQRSAAGILKEEVIESDEFRKMQLSDAALSLLFEANSTEYLQPGDVLTVLYPFSKSGSIGGSGVFWLKENALSTLNLWKVRFIRLNRSGYLSVREAYTAIWNDVKCFPVTGTEVSFENSWMFERTYGGKRGHEGTDLMPAANLAGVYPVVSMTDGVVEKIGWLEQGGYRIGIRSPGGGYFYYAHLDSYAQDFAIGEAVYAGEQLGLMGDSGYGREGTVGQFAVHLHVGIYVTLKQSENSDLAMEDGVGGQTDEVSVNPYWVLRYAAML